ncbi:MAG: hypothetical protein ACERKD_06610 [Prolixibacteraceae bacterium]
MNIKLTIISALIVLSWVSCIPDEPPEGDINIIYAENNLMPEKLKATDEASGVQAAYIYPTSVYQHAILGDTLEAEGLRVYYEGKYYDFILDTTLVFEDIRPRLVDLNNDGMPEIITILSSITKGASVTILEFVDNVIQVYATTGFIGTRYRWLNIAAIDDLDNDGEIEIAFVSTPHIGGYLHIAHVDGAAIYAKTQQPGVSNHKIGSRNLCLSAITVKDGIKTLYLPTNEYDAILGFQWKDQKLVPTDTIAFNVDPLIPLSEQYTFEGLQEDKNCINGE